MKEEIAKVMTMVQEGKLDVEKATELLHVMRGTETGVHSENSSAYNKKMLRVQVVSTERDNINVNLPINLVKAVLKAGHGIATKVPQAEKYVKDIDIDLLLQAIENEIDGQIVDITYANGDKVSVVIE
ncbi:MAG: SHOCT-like domain-containing protein [Bacillota bacterium]